jgi:hypothetical protein
MTKYNWDEIDEQWNWVAMDGDGFIFVYEKAPSIDGCAWKEPDGGRYHCKGAIPQILNRTVLDDWTESLEERPKSQPRYVMDIDRWTTSWITDRINSREITMGEILDLLNAIEQ